MSILERIVKAIDEPPPELAFEIEETGIAWFRSQQPADQGYTPLEPGILSASPLRENVLRPDDLAYRLAAIAPPAGPRKRRQAALILPDYCARVAVLDFDSFPKDPKEQLPLVRFRVKKTVPFDLDAAAVGYFAQPSGGKKVELIVAVVQLEILAKYEAAVRAAQCHPGYVTTSTLATLSLLPADPGVQIFAKLCGRVLTVVVLRDQVVRLYRCLELDELSLAAILAVLRPTVAFIEDETGITPQRLLLCGFEGWNGAFSGACERELQLQAEPLRSRFGTPGQHNAGLLGYLESSRGAA